MLTEGVGSNGRTSGTQILKEAVERDLNVLQVLEVSRGSDFSNNKNSEVVPASRGTMRTCTE
jgi:hypothetical protein